MNVFGCSDFLELFVIGWELLDVLWKKLVCVFEVEVNIIVEVMIWLVVCGEIFFLLEV